MYIRKVHFRDAGMIRQIEEKVVNRLRQVTSAIRQAGANQVSVITSSAERDASIEFAKAAAIRPNTLGQALREIAQEPAVVERAVRDSGDAEAAGQRRAAHAAARRVRIAACWRICWRPPARRPFRSNLKPKPG